VALRTSLAMSGRVSASAMRWTHRRLRRILARTALGSWLSLPSEPRTWRSAYRWDWPSRAHARGGREEAEQRGRRSRWLGAARVSCCWSSASSSSSMKRIILATLRISLAMPMLRGLLLVLLGNGRAPSSCIGRLAARSGVAVLSNPRERKKSTPLPVAGRKRLVTPLGLLGLGLLGSWES